MGEIIAFPANMKPAGAMPPQGDGARILFFLGVRYVRLDEERTKGAPSAGGGEAAGRGRKRKRRA